MSKSFPFAKPEPKPNSIEMFIVNVIDLLNRLAADAPLTDDQRLEIRKIKEQAEKDVYPDHRICDFEGTDILKVRFYCPSCRRFTYVVHCESTQTGEKYAYGQWKCSICDGGVEPSVTVPEGLATLVRDHRAAPVDEYIGYSDREVEW